MGQALSFCGALLSRKCKCTDVIDDIVFKPPCPCSYIISEVAGTIKGQVFINEVSYPLADNVRVFYLPVKGNQSICCMHIVSQNSKAVIIYSHANAADCGTMLPRCTQIAVHLDVDVIIYDYEGYGYSDGSPSEAAMLRDLELVFKFALGAFSPKHIFLYGESIGSVPTCNLCSQLYKQKKRINLSRNLTGEESATFIPLQDHHRSNWDIETPNSPVDSSVDSDPETVSNSSETSPRSSIRTRASLIQEKRKQTPSLSHSSSLFGPNPRLLQINIEKQLHAGSIQFNTLVTPIGGIILHSAIVSGRKLLPCSSSLCCIKAFSNEQTARTVNVPVFHIHGMKDDIVPFSLGEQLYNMTNSSYEPWWVPDAHHNDIVYTHEKEYYDRLGVFVSSCLSR
ncbi:hypothetical protein WA588_002577, partial [Blastocystis sp. NMH]